MVGVVERLCRRYLVRQGWAVTPVDGIDRAGEYVLYSYQGKDGRLDYDRYKKIQVEGNRRKIANVWADRPTIEFLGVYLKRTNPGLSSGLCHGSRNGAEVQWFRELTEIDVRGTDISETANDFNHLSQWDFHEVNPAWVGEFDFVYTNSHDHAYDPKKAFDAWTGQLKPGGVLLIEHTMAHSGASARELDPFGVHPMVLPFLVSKWGAGRYAVAEILEPPHTKPNGLKIWIFVIRNLPGQAG